MHGPGEAVGMLSTKALHDPEGLRLSSKQAKKRVPEFDEQRGGHNSGMCHTWLRLSKSMRLSALMEETLMMRSLTCLAKRAFNV